MKKLLVIGLLLLSFIVCATGNFCEAEEKFPAKPVNLIIGYVPGGSADLPNRALAAAASKVLGQPVVVLNRPGGGGTVALGEFKNAQPDGYTISIIGAGTIAAPHLQKVFYDPVNDFDAIIQAYTLVYGLVVRADSPFKSLKDLIAYAEANPNKIKYSTGGVGTSQHLTMVLLGDLLKLKWTHIPFGGGVEAISALLGGHVDCSSQTTEWKPYVLSGRLRLLATYGERRIESFPDIPTLTELGYNITALTTSSLVAPKGIPQDRLKILHDAFHEATNDSGFRDVLRKLELQLAYKNSHDTQMIIKQIYEMSGKMIEKVQKQ